MSLMTKLLAISNIHKEVHLINPDTISRIGYEGMDENEVNKTRTCKLVLVSGETFEIDLNYINALVQAGHISVTDPIAQLKEFAENETDDVNDTEYTDDTPMDDPVGVETSYDPSIAAAIAEGSPVSEGMVV
jgi:hypothetical protein